MQDFGQKPFYLTETQQEWVRVTLCSMTDDEKAEQLFFALLHSNEPRYLENEIRAHRYGGVMFRSGPACEVQEAVNTLESNSPIPLLTAANLESGGNGAAFEGTDMGSQMLIAATGSEENACRLGRVCGREGRALGLNMAFAPVLDIDMDFHNPVTNVRTYGDDPARTVRMGRAYVRGLAESGLSATIKHFPGDGSDERDQHLLTAVNRLSLADWEASYGKIYRAMVQDGARAVMVGHIAMPAMEEFYDGKPCEAVIPGSYSRNVMRYLREQIGFSGLIISDASPMVGFTSATMRREAVPGCIENGIDMILFGRDLHEDLAYMKEGIQNGLLSRTRLDEAVSRILAMKASLGLPEAQRDGRLCRGREALEVIGCPEHRAWAKECADAGITLVKDTQKLLPLDSRTHPRVLLEILGDFPSNERVLAQFEKRLTEAGFTVTRYVPETLETIFLEGRVADFRRKYDLVFYIGNIENASNKTTARINWHTLFGAGNNLPWFAREVPTLFVSVGNPYHLFDVPMIKTFVNSYGNSPQLIDCVMDKLLGLSAFVGHSPIDPFCGRWDTKF